MSLPDSGTRAALPGTAPAPASRHPGLALLAIAVAPLAAMLNFTVVNAALPGAGRALGFSGQGLVWVMNAYVIAFAVGICLGGRDGDILGRRKFFVIGSGLFTAASLAGGMATGSAWLVSARAAQGLGGGFAAANALAWLAAIFPAGARRGRAAAAHVTAYAAGPVVGLLAAGAIAGLSWRWLMWANVPAGLLAIALSPFALGKTPAPRPIHQDQAGVWTGVPGLVWLVYALLTAPVNGWRDPWTAAALGASALLLAAFVAVQRVRARPFLRLRLLAGRSRPGALAVLLFSSTAVLVTVLAASRYLMLGHGYGPVAAGLAMLPLVICVCAGGLAAARMAARAGGRRLMVAGGLPVAAAMAWMWHISPATGYLAGILPSLVLLGGYGTVAVACTLTIMGGVPPGEIGVMAAIQTASQLVGGLAGVAILATAAPAAARYVVPPGGLSHAVGAAGGPWHGWGTGFAVTAVFTGVAVLVALAVVPGRPGPAAAGPVPVAPG